MAQRSRDPNISPFLAGKSEHTLALFDHFVKEYEQIGAIRLEATKSMIAVDDGQKRLAWVTQLGKNFIHVVFPLKQPYEDNLCFQKIGQVPGSSQFNHHFRMYFTEDINDEVRSFMRLALEGESD